MRKMLFMNGYLLVSILCLGLEGSLWAGTASYVGIDSTTKGDWRTVGATPTFKYGSDGFCVIGDSTLDTTFPAAKPTGTMPSYVVASVSQPNTIIFPWDPGSYTPGNPNNLLIGSDFTSSDLTIGQIWWGWNGSAGVDWYIDLRFTDENVHQVAFYANEIELGRDVRTTQFEVYDNSGNVDGPGTWGSPSPGTLLADSGSDMTSLYTAPKYAIFYIKGHVQIKVRGTTDGVGVLNGIFFDAGTGAVDPEPKNTADDVLRDSMLSWAMGKFPATHNIYFGQSFDDVNSATVPTASGLTDTSFDPGRLEFGQTYYWRVDEVNATPDKTVFKGAVWSFTAEPYSIQIPGSTIAVTASSVSNEFSTPQTTIDGSGLDANNAHDIAAENMWFTAAVDLDPWIQYEFDDIMKLDTMKIWNSNGAAESAIGWGVKDVEIQYSVDGETWDVLADANQFSRAPGLPTYSAYDEIAFDGIAAKVVRLNIMSNWGGILMSYSLSEVQFDMIPAAARTPDPADGSTEVLPNAVVSWRAGRDVAQHTIYVSTDENAVADGSASSVTSSTNSLDLTSLGLELDQTYYWRVDEVNEAETTTVWEGSVWSLSTMAALVVEDFESYNNVSPNRPFQAWLDGFGYSSDEFFPVGYPGNGTEAGIGHDIWSLSSPYYDGDIMETSNTIPGSSQSMPFYYSNTGGASTTEHTFALPQDWTVGGVKTLSIAFNGQAGNTGTMFVVINNAKITYQGDALNSIGRPVWQMWYIDLATVGTTLTNITKLQLGVEGNGSGMLLFDDIKLHPEPIEFFASDAASTATYVGIDSTTKGDWRTVGATPTFKYGSDGFCVIGDSTSDTTFPSGSPMPSYVVASCSPETITFPVGWGGPGYSPGNPNNLLIGSDFASSDRTIGQIWWGWNGSAGVDWYIDLRFTDENVHQVAFYANEIGVDTDVRTTQFEVYDNSDNVVAGPGTWGSPSPGTLLATSGSEMTSLYTAPKYAIFNIKGHVQIKVRGTTDGTSVLNGIFFD